jgi:lysophospholipase L1-like esterase
MRARFWALFAGGGGIHPDIIAWSDLVTSDGGSVTAPEKAALSTFRTRVDSLWSTYLRDVRVCCLANTFAKRRAIKAAWGSAVMTLTGTPGESDFGYVFDGTDRSCNTGLVPNSVAELSVLNHGFLVGLYDGIPATGTVREIFGQTQTSGTLRISAKWRTTNVVEIHTGPGAEVAMAMAGFTSGPGSGTVGGSAVTTPEARAYSNGQSLVTDSAFSTTTKGTNSELIGKMNGGTVGEYYSGTISGLIRFVGLTQAQYVLLSNAWEELILTLGMTRCMAWRGDSRSTQSGTTGISWGSMCNDATTARQYGNGKNRGVGGTTVAQIATALDTELASATDGHDTYKVPGFSAGRNDIRTVSTAAEIHAAQLSLVGKLPAAVAASARWLEAGRQAATDEKVGTAYGDKITDLGTLMDAAFGQRHVRWYDALMCKATIGTLTDIQDLDNGYIPGTLRADTTHWNATGQPHVQKMLWEAIRYGMFKYDNPPTNVFVPFIWITATAGSAATIGQVLNVTPGGWGGNPTYTYQWQKDGVDIGGATAASYTAIAAGALTCIVSATNAYGGPITATSNSITVT